MSGEKEERNAKFAQASREQAGVATARRTQRNAVSEGMLWVRGGLPAAEKLSASSTVGPGQRQSLSSLGLQRGQIVPTGAGRQGRR